MERFMESFSYLNRAIASNTSTENVDSSEIPGSLIKLRSYPGSKFIEGNRKHAMLGQRVLSAIPNGVSIHVQIALGIEAIEDLSKVHSMDNMRIEILPLLQRDLTQMCCVPNYGLLASQRVRKCELMEQSPKLLEQVMCGFTPKLELNDRNKFIDTLIKSGKRKLQKCDEFDAINEDGVLHIALSYRHVHPRKKGESTISLRTAEEAYEIICNIPSVTQENSIVRVWVDQNLHRYKNMDEDKWYEIGFLPYLLLTVVSALGKHNGFTIGLTRPWIWVETGAALYSDGVYCMHEYNHTIEKLVNFSPSSEVSSSSSSSSTIEKNSIMNKRGCFIRGGGLTLLNSLRVILKFVSLWTIDVLNHKEYNKEFIPAFERFVVWARGQVVRLKTKLRFDIKSKSFDNINKNMLLDIAWARALPSIDKGPSFYLRMEVQRRDCWEFLSLLAIVLKWRRMEGNIIEFVEEKGIELFCLQFSSNEKVLFNVNPAVNRSYQTPLVQDREDMSYTISMTSIYSQWLGGFCYFDGEKLRGRQPKYFCDAIGTIFNMRRTLRTQFGLLDDVLQIGGLQFSSTGYERFGQFLERVYRYEDEENGDKILLLESDVLCILQLNTPVQRNLIHDLRSQYAVPTVAKILEVQSGAIDRSISPNTLGVSSNTIIEALKKQHERSLLSNENEVNISRFRLDPRTYVLRLTEPKFGHIVYSFKVKPSERNMEDTLLGFKTNGDISETLEKISLMMGNTKFDQFHPFGLGLAPISPYQARRRSLNRNYHGQFELHGSEIRLCDECGSFFSPVNQLKCMIWSSVGSRTDGDMTENINVHWLERHTCGDEGRECGIVGPVT